MSEERLIEITSKIKEEGPLSAIAYIMSLNENDVNLFFQCVEKSKYRNLSFLSAVFAFSDDYLRSKNLSDPKDDQVASSGNSYIDQLFSEGTGRSRK